VLLAMIWLWCSTIAMLRHTDDFSSFQRFRTHRAAASNGRPAAPLQDDCIAHKWMDASQFSNAVSALHNVPRPMLIAVVRVVPADVLHLVPFSYTSLRAPPLFS
jgi:hypothetical protein